MENKKKKIEKLREVLAYFGGGFIIGIDIIIGYFLYTNRQEFFNFAIDFSRSIELGFLVVKIILLVIILAVNLKIFKSISKQWKKENYIKVEEKRKGEEEIKRLGFLKKMLFYWRVNGARKWMDKYNEEFTRIERMIGKIRGKETKELLKLREEMIKGILIWTDDFQITRFEYDKKGNKKSTQIPVTKEFLEGLYVDELYEDYLLNCVDTAENFINGYSEIEQGEKI